MDWLKRNVRIGSFHYGDERIDLIPSEMERTGAETYEKRLPDGLCAVLEAKQTERYLSVMLRFENRGEADSGAIWRVRTAHMTLLAGRGVPVWRSFKGDSCGAESFNPLETALTDGEKLHVEPKDGRSSNTTGFPFFDIDCGGRAYAFGIGWSGQWMQEISAFGGRVRVEIGLADADFYLKPGESVRGPGFLMVEGTDSADARRAFRQVMLDEFSPAVRLGKDMTIPIALQPFDRYFYNPRFDWYKKGRPEWATEQGQIMSVDAALKCKFIDALWLDAAWFKNGFPDGVGNYSFAEGFPRGLKPVTDYAHEKGLRFVLWFEPERIDCHSEVFRDHRDMLLKWSGSQSNYMFNLADDRARAWLKETLIQFIRSNGIDVYRQDFNFDPLPYWRENDEEGRKGLIEMKYIAGLYDLWDSLTEAFPGLLIDNCASGGRRIDLETCRRAVPLWRSDTGCSPVNGRHRGHTWSQNHIMALTQFIPYHACATWEDSAYHIRSAQSNGIACNFDVLNPEFGYERAEKILGEVARHRRYWSGDFYPLSAIDNSEEVWAAWQLACGNEGVAYAFRRDFCPQGTFTLRLQAVDGQARYEVTVTDEDMNAETRMMTGAELAELTVRCGKPCQSVSVEYKKA